MPLIVGGGPAGAAAAIRLARHGLSPIVVERTPVATDPLCGGFLSWNAVRLLETCGVDPFALGAQVVRRFRMFAGGRGVDMRLPAAAAGLSRKRLDQALLDRAAEAGATVMRGVTVRAIEGNVVRYADGTTQTPNHLILASGKHDIRGAKRPAASSDPSIGLRWRFPASSRLAELVGDAIELYLFRDGYAGLVLQEDGAANLCLTVRLSAFVAAGHNPDTVLATIMAELPVLAERLAGDDMGDSQAIANVPYGWRAKGDCGGLYRVGDQIGVIPSFVGEGVGLALATGLAAADALIGGRSADVYQATTSRKIALPIRLATQLWRAAENPALGRMLPLFASLPGMANLAMQSTRVAGD